MEIKVKLKQYQITRNDDGDDAVGVYDALKLPFCKVLQI